jgi:tRNA threonylcarbamoyladenosine biosynthesis protein TsaB
MQEKNTELVLGIDTCGARGTIALSRLVEGAAELIAERELPERNEAATILGELEALLAAAAASVKEIGIIVVVNGPGSFTGVRIGVSTALGLGAGIGAQLVALSRLELLAALGGCDAAALDAHRHEVYLRVSGGESLANTDELKRAGLDGRQVAVCDDAAEAVLWSAVPDALVMRAAEPTAGFAIQHAVGRIVRGEFAEPLQLDGNYLRRSDAEIFWKTR